MLADVQKDFQRHRLAPHLVYESYDEETGLFFNRGSFGFVLQGLCLVGAELSAQNEMAEFLKEENNLPEGACLQITLIGSKNISRKLEFWESQRKGEIFEKLAAERVRFLKEISEKGDMKDIFVLISLTIPKALPSKDDIFEMERRRDKLIATLRAIEMRTQPLGSEELLWHLRNFFETEEFCRQKANPLMPLREQILSGDFSFSEDKGGFSIEAAGSKKRFVSLEAMGRPSSWELRAMDLFLGDEMRRDESIASDFFISLLLLVEPRQGIEKAAVLSKSQAAQKTLASSLGKFFPNLMKEREDLDAAFSCISNKSRVVHLLQFAHFKDEGSKAEDAAAEFSSMMRRKGWNFVPCDYDHFASFLSSMPMCAQEGVPGKLKEKDVGVARALKTLGRGKKTVSDEAKALAPIIGEWRGMPDAPGMIFGGRRGQAFFWTPFQKVLLPQNPPSSNENFNLCIAGVPGSGKSVFMQELMISTLGVGGSVFVMDYGKSFKRSCQILGGSYMEFDTKNPVSLNPFSEIPTGESPEEIEARDDAMRCICELLPTMACPTGGGDDRQRAILQKALYEVWRKKKNQAEITDIANWLLKRNEDYCQDLGNQLFPFTREGLYGKFFSGPAGISLESRIVVIETDNLSSAPELMAVVVQLMIFHINRAMIREDRAVPKLLMIDEAWKLLAGKISGQFIEEATRIARKYKGSISLATQQLGDYFRQEGGAAEFAFLNSSCKAILKQPAEGLLAMRHNPKLASFVEDDYSLSRLQSVHSNPPHYSESLLFSPGVNGVLGRLRLDPFTLLLTSTNAADYDALEAKTRSGLSVSEAVVAVLKERGQI